MPRRMNCRYVEVLRLSWDGVLTRVVFGLRMTSALRLFLTVSHPCSIVVRVPPLGSIVSPPSCMIIWGLHHVRAPLHVIHSPALVRDTDLHGRVSVNSVNSVGDTEARGHRFCVSGGMKALTSGTWCGVSCPAVDELAHPQQAPLKLHEETWAGLLKNQGLKISQEVEIVPGCAVSVARPSCPDNSLVSPGPGRMIRNMLAWSLMEKTEGSGVWLFRGALQGVNLFSSLDAIGEWGEQGVVPHSVVGPIVVPLHLFVRVWVRPRYRATYWRAVLAAASRCVEGYRTPDEAMVC